MNKLTVKFKPEKETKNTYKFTEVLQGPLDVPKVGTVYVPKTTLKEIGYNPGGELMMDLYVG